MQWTMGSYVNNVAGLISLTAGWVLWVTSVPAIRRRFFNLFYSCHIAGTVVFMLFAFMHRKDIMNWVLPGVFLYLLDCVLRTLQQAFNWTRVSTAAIAAPGAAAVATLSPHNSVLTVTIQCDRRLSWSGLDIVFLNVPELSWWQWHPFTLATSSAAGDTKMVLHIKSYNHWTQRLASRLATDPTPVKLYVSGPYHGAHRKWITKFDRHIFVAGGIGVTPPLGMLQDLIARRRSLEASMGSAAAGRASLIWISRSRDELGTLPYDVLYEASRTGADAWLDLQLYLTTAGEGEEVGDEGQTWRASGSSSTGFMVPVDSLTATTAAAADTTTTSNTAAANAATVAAAGKIARPLSHDYVSSPLLWAASVLLCFGGGFAGFICAQSYEAHVSRTVALRKDYTHVGMLQFAALGLGASLPPALLMLAFHLIRELKARRSCAEAAPGRHQQQRDCPLCDKDFYAAAAGVAACRLGSALQARMSVTSNDTFLSDDTIASSVEPPFPPSTDCKTAAKSYTGGGPSPTATVTTHLDSCLYNHHLSASPSPAPFTKQGRPDLPALLEAVSQTGGGPAAQPPVPSQLRRPRTFEGAAAAAQPDDGSDADSASAAEQSAGPGSPASCAWPISSNIHREVSK